MFDLSLFTAVWTALGILSAMRIVALVGIPDAKEVFDNLFAFGEWLRDRWSRFWGG